MIKLFVGGFPPETDEMQLAQMVGNFGRINTIQIIRDKQSKKSKGYAFIEMIDLAGAEAVIANLNGNQMGVKQLSINIATAKNEGLAFTKFNRVTSQSTDRIKRPRRHL
jgi:RNA recognition motif-containing protein